MIKTKGLMKQFPNETAIRYRDLVFEDGKKYILLGASGCGKFTLLNMLAGILSPDEGEVEIDGVSMSAKSQKEKDRFRIENIGYIFQDFRLIENMTVMDNLRILKLENANISKAPELLKRLGLYDRRNKKVSRLSGGQKQRVAIARAPVKEPRIILADEPTGSYTYEYQYVEMFGVKDNVYTLNIGDELSHEMDQLYTEFAYRLASWEV